ncbi:hypothetical protein [Bradyrhizobium sp. ERR14]|uniref:hypothetical protein n=1 Tax=Bradyrhizobium sp. ERR14 TaxID=2663837 RepID=UPI00160B7FDE|nr:hypothetical protein [Bradyrhizobium sp. ERR14]MBB4398865.1 hypothetical protein [Bradyrhizobium sp. ERR14]
MTIDNWLTTGVVAFSIVAGLAWFRSAIGKVKVPKENGKIVDYRMSLGDLPNSYQLIVDGVDVYRTAALQAWWNAGAATAASIAALLQAVQAWFHWPMS